MHTPMRAAATRDLPHPAGAVFAAWIDPAQIGAWMFAGDVPVGLSCDPVAGGAFSFTVRRAGQVLHHAGRYLRIEPARALSFTWEVTGRTGTGASLIDVTLRPSADGCTVTVTHYLAADYDPAEVAQHEADLGRMLGTLDEHLRRVTAGQHFRPSRMTTGTSPAE